MPLIARTFMPASRHRSKVHCVPLGQRDQRQGAKILFPGFGNSDTGRTAPRSPAFVFARAELTFNIGAKARMISVRLSICASPDPYRGRLGGPSIG